MMTTQQIINKYGEPNITGQGYLVHITLPYPMRLSWDLETTITRMSCHKLVADQLIAIFNDLFYTYGYDELKRLGIDLYGGCFNFRAMRGGSNQSTHSWGIAIDLDPIRNQLRENHTTARFARPEYKKMIEIFEYNGFESLGKVKDYDWMHFQTKA